LPNALIPVLTLLGLQFSFLLAGAIIVETVFGLPGIGRLIFQATAQRDLMVVRSVVLVLVAAVVTVNFLVELGWGRGRSALAAGARRMKVAAVAGIAITALVIGARCWAPPACSTPASWLRSRGASPRPRPRIGSAPTRLAGTCLAMIAGGARTSLLVALAAVAIGVASVRLAV